MSSEDVLNEPGETRFPDFGWDETGRTNVILAEVVSEPPRRRPRVPLHRRWKLQAILFVATCLSTFFAGSTLLAEDAQGHLLVAFSLWHGLAYGGALMTILVCHEAGHYLQTRRYGIPATLPYFIPMPLTPLGTMGAVIAMDPRIPNRRALFDVGITGPLWGLVPTLIFCTLGLSYAHLEPANSPYLGAESYGEPLLFHLLARWFLGPVPHDQVIVIGSLAKAGWVGLLITAINLFPIGQLDGGHVLYAISGRRAHRIAVGLLLAAAAATAVSGYWWWWPMLLLLVFMGPKHPPTQGDTVPLGRWRYLLGWLTLLFVVIGFTPDPFNQAGGLIP